MQRRGRGTSRGVLAALLTCLSTCLLTVLVVVTAGLAVVVATSATHARAAGPSAPSGPASTADRYVDSAAITGRQVTVAPVHRRVPAHRHHLGAGPAVLPAATTPSAPLPTARADVPVHDRAGSPARAHADSRAPPA